MSILSYKYKAHKLVNTLFYVVVFVIGFVLGFGAEKIDFNKLVSQVLIIDNAKALEIGTIGEYTITDEFIYNQFNNFQEGFLEEYPYVYCDYQYSGNMSPDLDCHAYSQDYFSRLYVTKTYDAYYQIGRYAGSGSRLYFSINYSGVYTPVAKYEETTSSTSYGFWYRTTGKRYIYTNFDRKLVTGSSSTYSLQSIDLDFEQFSIKVEYNENLFKDNPDFKEVCVNNYDTFSITSNNVDGYDEEGQPYYHSFDFLWFPNGMKGISTYRYDTEEEDHVYIFEESEDTFSGWWYWLNTKEEIDLYFGRDNPGLYLSTRGYTDKYKYYNYTMYPFEMAFTPSYHYYQIFWFKDPYIEYLDGIKKDDSEKYCFYIKNEYDVNILNHDSMGDVYGDVTILGGTVSSDSTSKNLEDLDNSSLPNTLYSLLSRLRTSINFVVYYLEGLFYSMPVIFQMFIISVLLVFALKIIINMIVK